MSHVAHAGRRCTLALLASVAALAGPAGVARAADSASVAYPDAAAAVNGTLTISGNSDFDQRLYAKARPADATPCAARASDDPGRSFRVVGSEIKYATTATAGTTPTTETYNSPIPVGAFSRSLTGKWDEGPGTFRFCVWLAGNPDEAALVAQQDITVRKPNATLTVAASSGRVDQGKSLPVTATGTVEAASELRAKLRPAGEGPCAATFAESSGSTRAFSPATVPAGAFTATETIGGLPLGDYVLCTWITSAGITVAGPQPTTFSVVPPCIVPSIAIGTPLSTAVSALVASACTAGKQVRVAQDRVRKGLALGFLKSPGSRLPNGAPVDISVSTGKPCIAPLLKRGTKLRVALRKLRAGNCTVGKITRVRSKARRGTFVRFRVTPESRRPSKMKVGVVVSKGPRRS